jgi:hypothetical protein
MRRLAAHFRDAETDEEPDGDVRRLRIDAANRWRVAHGIAELREEDEDEPPELELYRRARAVGLSGRRG